MSHGAAEIPLLYNRESFKKRKYDTFLWESKMAATGVSRDINEISGDTDPLHFAETRDTYCFFCAILYEIYTLISRHIFVLLIKWNSLL